MNKRGTDKIISVYWFVVLFIVAGGVVYMAAVFYGAPYDVREVEANILINQIADCIATGGKLNNNWNGLDENNIFERCHLTFGVEDEFGWKDDQHFVNVSVYGFDKDKGIWEIDKDKKIFVGNSDLETTCNLGKTMPKCVERSFYVSDGEVIKIKVGIKKVNKNV